MKKVGQTTSELRNRKDNICNLPLNFVYITREANKEISDDQIKDYVTKITDEARATLFIMSFTNTSYGEEFVKGILKDRFSALRGNIKSHISSLL